MRILFYVNQLSGGGAERVITNLANHCAGQGDCAVVVNSFATEKEYELYDGVRHLYLDENEYTNVFQRNIMRIRELRKIIKAEKPDIAVAFMREPIYRLIIASRNLPVKTIVSVRNDPVVAGYAGKFSRILTKMLFYRADGYAFQTEAAMRWFGSKISDRARIIMNPVKNEFFNIQRAENPRNIVTLGRLSKQKNHELLIRAFADIQEMTDANLLIYGEGPLREELEELIRKLGLENRVYLKGNTSDVASVLKTAGLFVLSSDYEGMPNALMEAMAAGVPCISTDCPCGGPNMLFNSGENGILVPVGDQRALAEAMKTLLCDDQKLRDCVVSARAAVEQYRPESIYGQWDDFFRAVTKG